MKLAPHERLHSLSFIATHTHRESGFWRHREHAAYLLPLASWDENQDPTQRKHFWVYNVYIHIYIKCIQ